MNARIRTPDTACDSKNESCLLMDSQTSWLTMALTQKLAGFKRFEVDISPFWAYPSLTCLAEALLEDDREGVTNPSSGQ